MRNYHERIEGLSFFIAVTATAFLICAVLLSLSFAEQISARPKSNFVPRRTLVSVYYFNEMSGTITKDAASRSSGTLTSGPSWVKGFHGGGIGFAGGSDRVTLSNESNYDFIDAVGTFTIVLVRKFTGFGSGFSGFTVTKVNANSVSVGWKFRDTSVVVNDFSFEWADPSNTYKNYTPALPRELVVGGYRVVIVDYSSRSNGSKASYFKIAVDGKTYPISSDYSEPLALSFVNNNNLVINGMDAGLTLGTIGDDDMVAIYNGAGQTNLADGEIRMITEEIKGRY